MISIYKWGVTKDSDEGLSLETSKFALYFSSCCPYLYLSETTGIYSEDFELIQPIIAVCLWN